MRLINFSCEREEVFLEMELTRPRQILMNLGITDEVLIEETGWSQCQISQVLNNHRCTPAIQEDIVEFARSLVTEDEQEAFTVDYLFGPWSYKQKIKKKRKVVSKVA